MNALIVEDSGVTRRVMSMILRELGYDVHEAEDGSVGLQRLHAMDKPAVILVDWNMPVLDGLGFIEAVRSEPEYNDVRMMVVTTEVAKVQVARALAAGADEYLMKPFTRDMVVEKLALFGLEDTGPGGSSSEPGA